MFYITPSGFFVHIQAPEQFDLERLAEVGRLFPEDACEPFLAEGAEIHGVDTETFRTEFVAVLTHDGLIWNDYLARYMPLFEGDDERSNLSLTEQLIRYEA